MIGAHFAFGILAGATATFWMAHFQNVNISEAMQQNWPSMKGAKSAHNNHCLRKNAESYVKTIAKIVIEPLDVERTCWNVHEFALLVLVRTDENPERWFNMVVSLVVHVR